METKYWILVWSIVAIFPITIIALLLFSVSTELIAYLAVTIIAVILLPYSFYEYFSQAKLRRMEDVFPLFLKDLADNLRAGLTMAEAVRTASKSDYKDLNDEIKRMSNQMSWGVSFEKVIRELIERLKDSVYISRGLAILLQSYRSGGDISPIMSSVADSTILLQNVSKDQESSMTQQTAIIYVIQFVFIIITVVLFRVLIPITSTGGFGEVIITGAETRLDLDYYKWFFFVTIAIQSVCNGLVAGVTKSGSVVSGVKHVAIMFAVSLALFTIFILPKIVQVNVVSERYTVTTNEEFRIFGTVTHDEDLLVNQRVDVILPNETYIGFTDENGDYDIIIIAPDERGSVDGIVRVEYENQVAQAEFSFTVR
jgi:flagellar protein FlaJ